MKKYIVLLFSLLSIQQAVAQYNTDRLMITGRSALYYEDYVLSIQYFNQVLNAKPYLYEPWYFRGVAKFYLDDFVGAEKDVTKAIELNPYIYNMYELRGLCRIHQKNFDEAIADYTKSLSIEPFNQSAWYNRTLCRVEKKDYDTAQKDLDTIIAKWDKFSEAYSVRADIVVVVHLAEEADALRIFPAGIDEMFAFGYLAHLVFLVVADGKEGLAQLPVVDLGEKVGLVFDGVGTGDEPFLAIGHFGLCVVSCGNEIVVVSPLFIEGTELDEAVAHHVRVGRKPCSHFVHRVARHLVPVFLVTVYRFQSAAIAGCDGGGHLKVFF